MKLISLLAGVLVTGGVLFSSGQKNIKGTWRIDSNLGDCNTEVIRIRMHQGVWKGTIDIPSIKKYDQEILSVHNGKDSVQIRISDSDKINARWINDSTMRGVFESGGNQVRVELVKQ